MQDHKGQIAAEQARVFSIFVVEIKVWTMVAHSQECTTNRRQLHPRSVRNATMGRDDVLQRKPT